MTLLKNTFLYASLLLFLSTGILACGDNPVDSGEDDDDDQEEHSEAHGLRLILDGVEVYRVLEGQVSCQQEPCRIDVMEGDETALITVEFLDDDGQEIHEEDLEEDYSLGVEIADPDVADFEQGEDEGLWTLRIVGRLAGETRMKVELLHAGHADFTTPPLNDANAIVIRVTQNQ